MEEEEKPLTWADLMAFGATLTESQLKQKVTLIRIDEVPIDIKSVSDLGEDTYNFYEAEITTTKSDFDPDYFDPPYKTLEEACAAEEHVIIPADRVYLYDE